MKNENRGYSPADVELHAPVMHNNNNSDDDNFSDDDSSDAKQLFELPKRKIHRPPTLAFQRKLEKKRRCCTKIQYRCKMCMAYILPILIAIFIVSTVLCLAFLLIGVSGMKEEIEILKINLNNANAAQKTSLSHNSVLQDEYERKLEKMKIQEAVIENFKKSLSLYEMKLGNMSATLKKMQASPTFHLSQRVDTLVRDIDSIKSGMADTGADIEKLDNENKKVTDHVDNLIEKFNAMETKVYNMTVTLSVLQNKPIPAKTTTPKTLVVTLTPDEDQPITRKEANHLIEELKGKQKIFFENITQFNLDHISNWQFTAKSLNESILDRFSTVDNTMGKMSNQLQILNNRTDYLDQLCKNKTENNNSYSFKKPSTKSRNTTPSGKSQNQINSNPNHSQQSEDGNHHDSVTDIPTTTTKNNSRLDDVVPTMSSLNRTILNNHAKNHSSDENDSSGKPLNLDKREFETLLDVIPETDIPIKIDSPAYPTQLSRVTRDQLNPESPAHSDGSFLDSYDMNSNLKTIADDKDLSDSDTLNPISSENKDLLMNELIERYTDDERKENIEKQYERKLNRKQFSRIPMNYNYQNYQDYE